MNTIKSIIFSSLLCFSILPQTTVDRGHENNDSYRARKVRDGLQIKAEIDRREAKIQETIKVNVEYTNVSQAPIVLSKQQTINGYNYFALIIKEEISGFADGGYPVAARFPTRVIIEHPPSKEDFVSIPSGGTVKFQEDISLTKYAIPKTGNYELLVLYHSWWDQKDVPDIPGLWGYEHGSIHAKKISIKIIK